MPKHGDRYGRKEWRLFLAAAILTAGAGHPAAGTAGDTLQAMYERAEYVFGFANYDGVFADYKGNATDKWFSRLLRHMQDETQYRQDNFYYAFAHDSLPEKITSLFRDTLDVIWSEGSNGVRLTDLGFYSSSCESGPAYKLVPLEESRPMPCHSDAFVLLAPGVARPSQVVTYVEYEIDDPALRLLVDQALQRIADTNAVRCPGNPVLYEKTELHGRRDGNAPDTLFLTIHANNGSTEWTWHELSMVIRENDVWILQCLMPAHWGASAFRIQAAFDLDGDGLIEFLVHHGTSVGLYSILILNGRMQQRIVGPYRGC